MNPLVQVGVLGHWGANIGHDIMGLGIECVLKAAFGNRFECVYFEQHRPLDIYPGWHPLRHIRFLRHGRGGRLAKSLKLFLNKTDVSSLLWRSSQVDNLDLAIVCGGPLITPHVADGDLHLMFHHMFGAFASKNLPVLNLSVGSCYPWERIPQVVEGEKNIEFLKRVFEYSRVTTVRDKVAQKLCAGMGQSYELVADTGFVAGEAFRRLGGTHTGRRYIVINYQLYGANGDWGQNVDPVAWKRTLQGLIERVRRRYDVVFVCHSDFEFNLASELDSTIPRYQPKDMQEYADLIAGAVAGISSRIHAAIPLASIGTPVIGIGTDTRVGTLQTLGIPCFYVKEATVDLLEESLENAIQKRDMESERLTELREKTLNRYVRIVREAVE